MESAVLPSHALPLWQAALVLAPALVLGLAAALVGRRTAIAWRMAGASAVAAVVLASGALVMVALGHQGAGYGQRADPPGAVVLLLVAFVGWVIVRYSRRYLQGEPRELQYLRWLLATLATVCVVIATNHVLVLALAWMAPSLTLHHLLVFFHERPAALVAAHKKFIVARLADVCMAGVVVLLYAAFGTLHIDELLKLAAMQPQWPLAAHAAMLLLALAAVMKCAQLPFHGWLIQVMEAPTPVSALLHAGIVNLGGFVLIRFAPLVEQVPLAQALLVLVGATTAVLAALVMTTRISVKVMLAWSTCAQMGFMLMQCGLGAWDVALVHLLAHSLYKAHAFLSANGVVQRTMVTKMAPAQRETWGSNLLGMALGAAMVLLAGAIVTAWVPGALASPALWMLAGIVALALVPLVNGSALALKGWRMPLLALAAFAVALGYFSLHLLSGAWLRLPMQMPLVGLCVFGALAFAALFWLQSLIRIAPHSPLAQRLYPWLYGGFFLDETFNAMTFRVWPPAKRPMRPNAQGLPVANALSTISGVQT